MACWIGNWPQLVLQCVRPWQLAFWITYEHTRQAMGVMLRLNTPIPNDELNCVRIIPFEPLRLRRVLKPWTVER